MTRKSPRVGKSKSKKAQRLSVAKQTLKDLKPRDAGPKGGAGTAFLSGRGCCPPTGT